MDTFNEFNRFPNLDGLEWKLVDMLLKSTSKYAEDIWKLLYYSDANALNKPNLSYAEKAKLVCLGNDTSETDKRVFITPYINDAWTEQSAHLHIYVDALHSPNHLISNIHVTIETIVHSKLGIILGDLNDENSNPNDKDVNGKPIVIRKNRATVLLKDVLALFNGAQLDGIGQLQFNQEIDPYCISSQYLWNNRAYYGHSTKMVIKMSGASTSPELGF